MGEGRREEYEEIVSEIFLYFQEWGTDELFLWDLIKFSNKYGKKIVMRLFHILLFKNNAYLIYFTWRRTKRTKFAQMKTIF